MTEYYVQQNSAEEQARIGRFVALALWVTFAGGLVVIGFILAARWWAPLIPVESEKRFADRYINLLVEQMEPGDQQLTNYLDALVRDLRNHLDLPAEFIVTVHIVNDADANAFAMLGGHVFVFRGLLESMPNENALAMVIAHELAHVANRDPLVSTGRAVLFALLLFSATGQGNFAGTGSELALLSYSREQENMADLKALETLQRRYGHVGGATTFFEQVLVTDVHGEDELPVLGLLSSHPQVRDRIDNLRAQTQRAGWLDGSGSPYPAQVEDALRGLNQ